MIEFNDSSHLPIYQFMRNIIRIAFSTTILLVGLSACSSKMEIYKVSQIEKQAMQFNHSMNLNEYTYIADGEKYLQERQFDSANICLHKAYAVEPDNWSVCYLYGKLAFEMEEYSKAADYFSQSLLLCSKDKYIRSSIYASFGELYYTTGNLAKSKQHLLTALQLNPESTQAKRTLEKIQLLSQNE